MKCDRCKGRTVREMLPTGEWEAVCPTCDIVIEDQNVRIMEVTEVTPLQQERE